MRNEARLLINWTRLSSRFSRVIRRTRKLLGDPQATRQYTRLTTASSSVSTEDKLAELWRAQGDVSNGCASPGTPNCSTISMKTDKNQPTVEYLLKYRDYAQPPWAGPSLANRRRKLVRWPVCDSYCNLLVAVVDYRG
jgi:hypothetical protein